MTFTVYFEVLNHNVDCGGKLLVHCHNQMLQ